MITMPPNSPYYNQLLRFLNQADTDNLKTKDFTRLYKLYKGTKVKVGFGQGTPARVPWISFLREPNTTSNGIYPVYLYYKDIRKLILAYGVSETNKPDYKWPVDAQPIKELFEQNNWGKPDRYGDSLVFKIYDRDDLPNKQIIDNDLDRILELYESMKFSAKSSPKPKDAVHFETSLFFNALRAAGLNYSRTLVTRFCASLLTKPFVILTGLSGSGKTKLAQAFVQWICQDNSQYRVVPVGADWTNREPLLGYPNALKQNEYVKPDSGVLDLIIQANRKPELPHFLILDEMNLSHVERYFADFLSAMESKEEIPLYAEGTVDNGVPSRLRLPSNLFIIGTVNIDETTHMFSPKVLDRANTIEFRISDAEMEEFLGNIKDFNPTVLTKSGAVTAKSFLQLAQNKSIATTNIEEINQTLIRFFRELKKPAAEFGYRSATEILRLIHQLSVLDGDLTTHQKVDIAIIQKLLPKLHGSRRKLCPVLVTLGSFCIGRDVKMEKDVFDNDSFDFNGADVLYPLSLEKIARMYRGAIDNGFTSFAEA